MFIKRQNASASAKEINQVLEPQHNDGLSISEKQFWLEGSSVDYDELRA